MYTRMLRRICSLIRKRQYTVTYHARKEMQDDNLTIYDVERGILTGQICERQRDDATAESKYRIRGVTIDERDVEVITKISPTAKLVIITVYLVDEEDHIDGV
ncbi:DUF4258 domain-containing protein [Candidatus Entotheonella palauensis]|uniref:DUF4258 domain-containing protein n=1 Tax=Candidatus Entotheonella palauensis TaxID=93172 RepID=UPI000B7DDE3C|nr:DUF4258 domain-containing protein [Candidatus Entotheonella palauensis]